MGWIGGVVAIGMTFTLLVIDENELEKWCEKCCFSRSKNTKFYELDQQELASFINAVSETL